MAKALARWMGLAVLWSSLVGAHGAAEEMVPAVIKAYERGEIGRLERLAESLGAHPLAPWVESYRLALRLERGSDEGVAEFLARHEGRYVAERLRGEWVRYRMRERDWAGAWREYQRLMRPDAEMVCRGIDIRERLADERANQDATALLPTLPLMPACQVLFARLALERKLDEGALWQALRLSLAKDRLKEARLIAGWLPDGPTAKEIETAERQPAQWLARQAGEGTRARRELALFALLRLGKSDPRIAATRLAELEPSLSRAERAFLWGRLALAAAKGHLVEALPWYETAAQLGAVFDEEQSAWRVRAALRMGDWATVARALAAMPTALVERPEWRYWQARALAAQGETEKAREIWNRLATQDHFYGLLAREALGRPWQPPVRPRPPDEAEVAAIGGQPDLALGLALIRGGQRVEGVRAWNWGLAGLSDRELLAAAEQARRAGVLDRAIAAAERTEREHDEALRYPMPFFAEIGRQIAAVRLDPAWVYGLMRQESRFVMDATSRAGAKGLMQLMPATAKWVAKKIGITDFHPAKTSDLSTNVALGTGYLRLVLDALGDHPVLAAAAYNAGPGRAKRWRGVTPLEAAIYIETIPFDETRDYVKKVLANTVHYTALMTGKPASLTPWLAPIPAAGMIEDTTELP